MPHFTKKCMKLVVCVIASLAMLTGLYVAQHLSSKKKIDITQVHGTLLQEPRPIHAFHLTGIDLKSFNNEQLRGQWTLIFFGFTHCSSMCPTAMAELGKMYRLLEAQQVKPLPRVVMITLDPERDSIQRLGQYVKAFDPHFYGAHGDLHVTHAMTKELGVAYIKIPRNQTIDAKNYDIEHTGTVMLFNPKGQLQAFFTTPHQAALLAKDYTFITSNFN